MNHKLVYPILTGVLMLTFSLTASAHTINYELAAMPQGDLFTSYLKLGFEHILPLGLDHILFILSLFFLSSKLKTILWQATAFTLAHSITLGLSMYGYIKPLPAVVEPIIALSIFFVAAENLLTQQLKPGRMAIITLFGLIHGMGFAGALSGIGLPPGRFFSALTAFNLGVELGQITVILIAYFLATKWFSNRVWYRSWIVQPASAGIALLALYWTIERTMS